MQAIRARENILVEAAEKDSCDGYHSGSQKESFQTVEVESTCSKILHSHDFALVNNYWLLIFKGCFLNLNLRSFMWR